MQETDNASIERSIEGPFRAKDLRKLGRQKHIDKLSIFKLELMTVEIAKGFDALRSLRHLFLWCPITRTAMRHVIPIENLEELDELRLRYPGQLTGFAAMDTLKVFRCDDYMTEADLTEIAKLPKLQVLSAHNSELTEKLLDMLLAIGSLEKIDLEATDFDDGMAKTTSQSDAIVALDVGATCITAEGSKHISNMKQLRSLDIWAIDIVEQDLEMLEDLPNLESVSIGGYDEQTVLTSKGVIPRLEKIRSLKRVWFDGIAATDDEKTYLKSRYEHACITCW